MAIVIEFLVFIVLGLVGLLGGLFVISGVEQNNLLYAIVGLILAFPFAHQVYEKVIKN